ITLAPDMEALRRLTLSGDVLVLPEAQGEHRSLVLEAMARGMAVVAAAAPLVTHLADRRTARLGARADAALWARPLLEVPGGGLAAGGLGASGWRFVAEQRRVGTHVGLVVDAYEWLGTRDTRALVPRSA